MDNMTAKVSLFARAYHYRNNKTHIFCHTFFHCFIASLFHLDFAIFHTEKGGYYFYIIYIYYNIYI